MACTEKTTSIIIVHLFFLISGRRVRIQISEALFLVQQNQPSNPMPTVELRVGMHCDKCMKEIKRALKKVEGIETYKMDTVQQKMTVTGDVTAKELIKTLVKSGKPACNWDDYPATQ